MVKTTAFESMYFTNYANKDQISAPPRDLFIHTLFSSVPFETAEILLAKGLMMSSQV